MRIAARIHQLRFERSLSLEEVAGETGLGVSLIARLEAGREVPSLEMLDGLAEAFGVPLYKLFYDDGETVSTSRLTPRPTLDELAAGCPERRVRSRTCGEPPDKTAVPNAARQTAPPLAKSVATGSKAVLRWVR